MVGGFFYRIDKESLVHNSKLEGKAEEKLNSFEFILKIPESHLIMPLISLKFLRPKEFS